MTVFLDKPTLRELVLDFYATHDPQRLRDGIDISGMVNWTFDNGLHQLNNMLYQQYGAEIDPTRRGDNNSGEGFNRLSAALMGPNEDDEEIKRRENLFNKLEAFYQRHDPSKLNSLEKLVDFAMYRGVDLLNSKLMDKYGEDLDNFGLPVGSPVANFSGALEEPGPPPPKDNGASLQPLPKLSPPPRMPKLSPPRRASPPRPVPDTPADVVSPLPPPMGRDSNQIRLSMLPPPPPPDDFVDPNSINDELTKFYTAHDPGKLMVVEALAIWALRIGRLEFNKRLVQVYGYTLDDPIPEPENEKPQVMELPVEPPALPVRQSEVPVAPIRVEPQSPPREIPAPAPPQKLPKRNSPEVRVPMPPMKVQSPPAATVPKLEPPPSRGPPDGYESAESEDPFPAMSPKKVMKSEPNNGGALGVLSSSNFRKPKNSVKPPPPNAPPPSLNLPPVRNKVKQEPVNDWNAKPAAPVNAAPTMPKFAQPPKFTKPVNSFNKPMTAPSFNKPVETYNTSNGHGSSRGVRGQPKPYSVKKPVAAPKPGPGSFATAIANSKRNLRASKKPADSGPFRPDAIAEMAMSKAQGIQGRIRSRAESGHTSAKPKPVRTERTYSKPTSSYVPKPPTGAAATYSSTRSNWNRQPKVLAPPPSANAAPVRLPVNKKPNGFGFSAAPSGNKFPSKAVPKPAKKPLTYSKPAPKKKAGMASEMPAGQPCNNYRLDMTGATFGVCVCGFPRSAHKNWQNGR